MSPSRSLPSGAAPRANSSGPASGCAGAGRDAWARSSIRWPSTASPEPTTRSRRSPCPARSRSERLERRAALLSILEGQRFRRRRPAAHAELRHQAVSLTGLGPGASIPGLLPGLGAATDPRPVRRSPVRQGHAAWPAGWPSAGVPMIAIHFNEMTVCDGWDTHSKNFEGLKDELLPMLDQGLSALPRRPRPAGPARGDPGRRHGRVRPAPPGSTSRPAATTGARAPRRPGRRRNPRRGRPRILRPTRRPIPPRTRSTRWISRPRCTTAWASTRHGWSGTPWAVPSPISTGRVIGSLL